MAEDVQTSPTYREDVQTSPTYREAVGEAASCLRRATGGDLQAETMEQLVAAARTWLELAALIRSR